MANAASGSLGGRSLFGADARRAAAWAILVVSAFVGVMLPVGMLASGMSTPFWLSVALALSGVLFMNVCAMIQILRCPNHKPERPRWA